MLNMPLSTVFAIYKKAVETIMKQILKIVKKRLPQYESYLVLTKKYLEARKPKRV